MNTTAKCLIAVAIIISALWVGNGSSVALELKPRSSTQTVDGQLLYIERWGDKGPRVVFEAGQGNDISTWSSIAKKIGSFAQVILYDRAGLGRSLPLSSRDSAITAEEVATRLRAVLKAERIEPPFILVGHSLGGLYVQMFARKYPRLVSGVVLLDSVSADAPSELTTLSTLEPGTTAFWEEHGVEKSNQQVRSSPPFPPVPLVVIAATDHGPFFREWEPTLLRLQEELRTMSPYGRLVVAKGSGHDVQRDRPELVISAVKEVIVQAGNLDRSRR